MYKLSVYQWRQTINEGKANDQDKERSGGPHTVMSELIQSIGECVTGAMDLYEIIAHLSIVSGTTIRNVVEAPQVQNNLCKMIHCMLEMTNSKVSKHLQH